MARRRSSSTVCLGAVGLMLMVQVAVPPCRGEESGEDGESGPVLLGRLTREEVEAAVPGWIADQIAARPDIAAAEALVAAIPGTEITVFIGTWCADSQRELSRLWRAFDEIGVSSPDEILYIGVDRDKRPPADWTGDLDLLRVPTFIVRRGGEELGRIVETAPGGIENDLVAILKGEKTGLITGSEDLLEVEAVH